MDSRRRAQLGSGLVIAGLVGLAAVAVWVALPGDPPPEQEEPPVATEPEPEPEPEPPPEVRGDAEVAEVVDLSITGTELAQPGSEQDAPVPVEDEAVDELVTALTDWLDAHLNDLQEGGEGHVAGADLHGEVEVGDLAGPGTVTRDASYEITVGARGSPEWARAVVEATTDEGETHRAVFAFTGGPEPELMGVEEAA